MINAVELPVVARDRAGKGAARKTRNAGLIPGVIYGAKQSATLVAIEPKILWAQLNKDGFLTQIFDLKLGTETHRVLARDVQFHPVNDRPIHVDFMRVTGDTKLHVAVPVHFINEGASPGLKRGGVLNIELHQIDVVCTAETIPHGIDIDLTGMDIGRSIHISQVKLPEGVRPFISDRDFTVASIAPPTVVKASDAETAAAAAPAADAKK
jgi:large subunit ribosomal protein L25